MYTAVTLLFISSGVAIFFFRLISRQKIVSMSELSRCKQELETRYDYMLRRKFELLEELRDKQKQLETLINNQDGMQIKTAADVCISEEDIEEKISTFLLATGKISLEQDHKIRKKMPTLRMDYLSAGVTLGYIDLTVSEKLSKGSWSCPQ